jgi:hypothetical protein
VSLELLRYVGRSARIVDDDGDERRWFRLVSSAYLGGCEMCWQRMGRSRPSRAVGMGAPGGTGTEPSRSTALTARVSSSSQSSSGSCRLTRIDGLRVSGGRENEGKLDSLSSAPSKGTIRIDLDLLCLSAATAAVGEGDDDVVGFIGRCNDFEELWSLCVGWFATSPCCALPGKLFASLSFLTSVIQSHRDFENFYASDLTQCVDEDLGDEIQCQTEVAGHSHFWMCVRTSRTKRHNDYYFGFVSSWGQRGSLPLLPILGQYQLAQGAD